MAASDYITPTPNLLPGTTAKADDVNEKFDAVNVGFERLPRPRPDSQKGFIDPIKIPAPNDDEDAANKGWVDGRLAGVDEAIDDLADQLSAVNDSISAHEQTLTNIASAIETLGDELSDLAASVNPHADIKVISDSSYTLIASDANKILWFTSANPVTLTMPSNSALPLTDNIQGVIVQAGEGQVTPVAGSGATVVASGDLFSTAKRYAPISFFRVQPSTWWIGGERA